MNSVEQLGAKLSSLLSRMKMIGIVAVHLNSIFFLSRNCVKLKLTYKKFSDSENMPGKYLK